MDTTFNGWANYETWNVSLYINNEYSIYSLAREWVEHVESKNEGLQATPEIVALLKQLDDIYDELNQLEN